MAATRWTDLDPDLVAPEISNRLVRAFLIHMERKHGAEAMASLVDGAGLPRAYLDDQESWVSAAYVDGLARTWARQHYGLRDLPGHDHPLFQTWHEVGRGSFTRERIGAVYSVLRAIGAPGLLYARTADLAPRANRHLALEHEALGSGHVRITCRATDSAQYDVPSHACWNLVGLLEGVPTIWGLPAAQVHRTACRHDDPSLDHCTYDVRFVERSLAHPVALGLGTLGAAAVAGSLSAALAGPVAGVSSALAGGLLVVAIKGWVRARSLQGAQLRDASRIEEMLGRSDQRVADLFAESQALRRSLLASRKLSGYLASDLVERIVADPELELELGGRRTDAAVLFADIVGFTPRCEPLPPEQVVDELNTYFAHVDPAFRDHGGIIDKRMGDGIMAVFVPRDDEDAEKMHARAVGCGLDMLRALVPCNAALAERGAAPMQIRVGVAAGPLVQGNMGSDVKLEHTVVGDTVNLAARLEGEATPGRLLVTASAKPPISDETGPFTETSRRTITVKGKALPVDVVELEPQPRG